MANYLFNGSEDLSIPDFDPAVDSVFFVDLDAADIASVTQTNSSVTVTLTNGNEVVLGGVIFASLTASSLQAGPGSNLQFAIGTTGADALNGNVAIGLAGGDSITLTTDGALALGNEGGDVIEVNSFEDARIFGGQGDDFINGLGSGSVAYGGLGSDTIYASLTSAGESLAIYGGNGQADAEDLADVVGVTLASGASAEIYGNAGDDGIFVNGSGDASVFGGRGDDTIDATINGGTIVGGLGTDTISVTAAGADASFSVFGGNGSADPADGDDVINVRLLSDSTAEVYGNGGDDDINILGGNGGTYSIFGGAGDDVIRGAGSDIGLVGDGSVIYGGLGEDLIDVDVAPGDLDGSITIYGGNGQADAADGDDLILVGAAVNGDDVQTATVYGNGGNDTIELYNSGTITAFGGAGNDTIVVQAGFGAHVLTGGIGNDTFSFVNAGNTSSADQIVSVTDMSFGQDVILFGGSAVTSVATVNQASVANFAALEALASTTAGQATIVNVAGGSLAGSYALYNDQVVEITGFTGTATADSFAALTA